MTRAPAVALTFTVAIVACTSSPQSSTSAADSLALVNVAWNPANLDVGTVQAVTEINASVLVFGSKGALTLTSGSLVSSVASITGWRSAGVVPSADGLSSWVVGVDASGKLDRIGDDGATDVSGRYGLSGDDVMTLAGGTGRIGFVLAKGLAVADGTNLTHYAGAATAIAAEGALVSFADGAVVRSFASGHEVDALLPGGTMVAYDSDGHLYAATSHVLYQIVATTALPVYDAGGRTIRQLAGAGRNVWFSVDGDLGVHESGHVAVASGGTLAADAKLIGSPSGDVWVVSGGQLLRFSSTSTAGGDEATWTSAVQPIYAALCSNCHSPAGSGKDSSHIDLSTYAAWDARRATVHTRIVDDAGTPLAMPPPTSSFTLTDGQRAAIAAWSK